MNVKPNPPASHTIPMKRELKDNNTSAVEGAKPASHTIPMKRELKVKDLLAPALLDEELHTPSR